MPQKQILQEGLSRAKRSRDTSCPAKGDWKESVNDTLGGNQGFVGVESFGVSLFEKLLRQSATHRPSLLHGQSPFVAPMITNSRDRRVDGEATRLNPSELQLAGNIERYHDLVRVPALRHRPDRVPGFETIGHLGFR